MERFHHGTDTKQNGAQRPNEQWGLKYIYGRPTHLLSNPLFSILYSVAQAPLEYVRCFTFSTKSETTTAKCVCIRI